MGVKGLWALLAPVGKPVTLESLEGLRIAIDTSIWLQQFQTGMEDKGETMESAYLKAFFMRICKLLFFKIRPVFVFDGETPGLKRKTITARRKHRALQDHNLRKRAEHLLHSLHPDLSILTQHGEKGTENVSSQEKLDDEVQWLTASADRNTLQLETKDSPIRGSGAAQDEIDLEVLAELPDDIRDEILSQSLHHQRAIRLHKKKLSASQFSQRQVQAAVEGGKRLMESTTPLAIGSSGEAVIAYGSDIDREFALLKEPADTSAMVPPSRDFHAHEGGGILLSDDEEGKGTEGTEETDENNEAEGRALLSCENEYVLDISIDPSDIDASTCLFDETFFAPQEVQQPIVQLPAETLDGSGSSKGLDSDISLVLSEADSILADEAAALSRAGRPTTEPVTVGRLSELQHACIALLQLFGIPWVQSPMEAEAQCAELQRQGLVDAVATEDSDAFLVGAEIVYRYLFNREQHVTLYRLRDVQRNLGLDRDKLIYLALLLGSDYTPGIKGIGPVTAMEILSEFHDLSAFKTWWSSSENNELPSRNRMNWMKARLVIPDEFPQQNVMQAYYQPTVDTSTEPFEWAHPDLDELRKFTIKHFGWTQEKADEVLLPILKNCKEDKPNKQKTLEACKFLPQGKKEAPLRPDSIKSLRIRNAILEMRNEGRKKRTENKNTKLAQGKSKRRKVQ